jgi:hypothetical protein
MLLSKTCTQYKFRELKYSYYILWMRVLASHSKEEHRLRVLESRVVGENLDLS